MVNGFKISLLSENERKHFMEYFMEEVFLSLVTLGI